MDLFQQKMLAELIKKYGFDIAAFKQQGGTVESKDEQLAILSFYHMNKCIAQSMNEYLITNANRPPKEMYSSISHLLFSILGDILKQVDKTDKEYSDKILEECTKLLHQTRGDIENDRFA